MEFENFCDRCFFEMRENRLSMRFTRFLCPWLFVLSTALATAAVPVIFDTDMGNDVDDALALAMLHSLTDRGECDLIGVTLTNASPHAAPYIRMMNRFYGRESLPVGAAVRDLPKGSQDGFLAATLRSAPGNWKKPGDAQTEPAVSLLRRLLAGSKEKVRVIQVGFSTNLDALLDSKPDTISPLDGVSLVREKVEFLSLMAGNFVEDKPEYNILIDGPAARRLLERWPAPAVFSGFEIGLGLPYPARGISQHFRYASWHPVAESYRAYKKMPYDRPTWDLTSVLYAVRPEENYFGLSEPGMVSVTSGNLTQFQAKPGGLHRYLTVNAQQKSRIVEALMLLSSEPPRTLPR